MSLPFSKPLPFGKYELIDRIAAGGMAEIFKARYEPAPGVTKQVVIKKILPHYAANKAFIAMFVNEARIAIGLSHGTIAQVFDFGEIDGDYFLAMELVDGPPLSKVLKRAKAMGISHLPPELAVYIAMEVLKGLHYAHTRNDEQGRPLKIVHRDVSPQNVLISFEGQIKLVDFGISRARNAGRDQAESKGVKGKYAYFAPEQARNKDIDSRTDVSSAGIVLYEMLTGELPYQGSMYDVMTQIGKGIFPRPREKNPGISAELERIVLKAMALEKTDRYQTAEAFQHDLSSYLSAQYPTFNSTQLSMLLQLLFEEELVREGRPVKLPREFIERAERWKQRPAAAERDDAGWVDESDPENEGRGPDAPTEMAQMPDEEDGLETRALQLPASLAIDPPSGPSAIASGSNGLSSPAAASSAGKKRTNKPLELRKTIVFGLAAAFIGFLGVFLIIRFTHGTLELRSTPAGAEVVLDGKTLTQTTPVQVPNLRSGREYHVEITAPGYSPWVNDVPLKGGQLLEVNAILEAAAKPVELPPALEVPGPTAVVTPAAARSADLITWPTSTLELDPARHHVDLEAAGAGSLTLDPRQTYAVSINKGPTLGWGFYVLNSAGAQAGALSVRPVLISGSTRLFAYRIPSALLGGPMPEETQPRTLLVKAGRSALKSYTVPVALKLSNPSGVLVQGLDAKATYELKLVRGTALSHVVAGHPSQGLLTLKPNTALRVSGAARLWLTLIDTPGLPTLERPAIEITDVSKKRTR